jgi:peptidoglycan/LPS O-acetylase OafA/YrhL
MEGVVYGSLIAWYDTSFRHGNGLISRVLSTYGAYSYSIYLLHGFVVFRLARLIHERVMDISSVYVALPWAAAAFLAMMPIAWASFRYIEAPALRFRRLYIKAASPARLDRQRTVADSPLPESA